MLLGSFLDCRLENRTVELSSGDKIVFYTDGINDARNLKKRVLWRRSAT